MPFESGPTRLVPGGSPAPSSSGSNMAGNYRTISKSGHWRLNSRGDSPGLSGYTFTSWSSGKVMVRTPGRKCGKVGGVRGGICQEWEGTVGETPLLIQMMRWPPGLRAPGNLGAASVLPKRDGYGHTHVAPPRREGICDSEGLEWNGAWQVMPSQIFSP